MLKCQCGTMFDFPDYVEDFSSEYFGRRVTHYMGVCPNCGSDDFEEMDKCEICGEWIDPGAEVCECCKEAIEDLASEIREKARDLTHKTNYNEFMSHLIEELDR